MLALGGAAGAAGLAGCSVTPWNDDAESRDATPTLTVATYESFIDAPSVSPGDAVASCLRPQHLRVGRTDN